MSVTLTNKKLFRINKTLYDEVKFDESSSEEDKVPTRYNGVRVSTKKGNKHVPMIDADNAAKRRILNKNRKQLIAAEEKGDSVEIDNLRMKISQYEKEISMGAKLGQLSTRKGQYKFMKQKQDKHKIAVDNYIDDYEAVNPKDIIRRQRVVEKQERNRVIKKEMLKQRSKEAGVNQDDDIIRMLVDMEIRDSNRAKAKIKAKDLKRHVRYNTESFSYDLFSPDTILKYFNKEPLIYDLMISSPWLLQSISVIFQLYRARDIMDYISTIVLYIGNFSLNVSMSTWEWFIESTLNLWPKKAEGIADDFENFCSKFDAILSGELLTTLRTFIVSVVSFRVLDKKNAGLIRTLIGSVESMSIIDFVPVLVQTISKTLRFGEAVLAGMPITEYLLKENPVQSAINRSNILLTYQQALYSGLPVPGMMCKRAFVSECKVLIDTITGGMKFVQKGGRLFVSAQNALVKLQLAYNQVNQQISGSTRDPPFAVLIHGNPGVGKGRILPFLAKEFSAIKGRQYEDSHMFHRVVTSQFAEGYEPASHPFIHYSEIGSKSDKILQNQGDQVVMEMTSVIDSLPFCWDMAAVDKKGTVYVNPEVVFIDTNTPDLGLKHFVKNPSAYERRFIYIEVSVKNEFRLPGSNSIDIAKSLAAGGDIMDRYLFKIYRKVATNNLVSLEEVLGTDVDIYEMKQIMNELYTKHIQSQELVRENIDNRVNCESLILDDKQKILKNRLVSLKNSIHHCGTHTLYFSSVLVLYGVLFIILCALAQLGVNLLPSYFNEVKRHLCDVFDPLRYLSPRTKNFKDSEWKLGEDLQSNGKLLVAISVFCVTVKFLMSNLRAKKINSESGDSVVQNIEQLSDCTDIIKRIGVKNTPHWNNIIRTPIPDIAKNDVGQILRKISKNVREIKISSGNRVHVTRVYGICSNYFLINKHTLPGLGPWVINIPGNNDINTSLIWKTEVINSEDVVPVCPDVVMLKSVHFQFGDITGFLYDGLHELKMSAESYINSDFTRSKYVNDILPTTDKDGKQHFIGPYLIYDWPKHKSGMCGSPVIVKVANGYVFGGIHSAGSDDSVEGMASVVTKEMVHKALSIISNTNFMPVSSEGYIVKGIELLEPHHKSPFNYEVLHGIDYYGRDGSIVMMNNKSEVILTPFSERISKIYGTEELNSDGTHRFGPPPMKPFTKDGIYYSPFNIALVNCNRNLKAINTGVLEKIITILSDRLTFEGLKPINLVTAINGVPGDPLSRRINVATSGGYGFPGKKRDYLPEITDSLRMPNRFLLSKIQWMLKEYRKGRMCNPVYVAHLKDEPRLDEKNVIGKTRVFYATPLDALIVFRMYIYPLLTQMMENHSVFGCAIGVDMHSGSHDFMVDFLHQHKYVLSGDFSSFDLSQHPWIRYTVFSAIYRALEKSGYNEFALSISRGILSDLIKPAINMNGDIFKMYCQPSGSGATAELNSLVVLVIMMYIWYMQSDKDFFAHVTPRNYGDDANASLSEYGVSILNNVNFAKCCEEMLGMKFTPPTKGESEFEIVTLPKDLFFLKRNFRYSKSLKRIVAPLSKETICKMVTWTIPSKSISFDEQMLYTIISSLYEYFFHIENESEYEKVRNLWIKYYCEYFKVPSEDIKPMLPSYEELFTKYKRADSDQITLAELDVLSVLNNQ